MLKSAKHVLLHDNRCNLKRPQSHWSQQVSAMATAQLLRLPLQGVACETIILYPIHMVM